MGWSNQRLTPNGTLNEMMRASLHTASMTSEFGQAFVKSASQGAEQKLMGIRAATSLLQSRDILEQDVTNWQPLPNSDIWWRVPNFDTRWHDQLDWPLFVPSSRLIAYCNIMGRQVEWPVHRAQSRPISCVPDHQSTMNFCRRNSGGDRTRLTTDFLSEMCA